MSEHHHSKTPSRRWLTRMTARSPGEPHRVSTPLELFFDLVFVVAVAFAASAFHHDISADHIGHGLGSYILVFFAIWWAWMNFTWFASAYDCDDAPYRVAVFVQMTGALIFAAGVPRAFEDRDFGICVIGYVVMRLALVSQWLRAALDDPYRRTTALRYAVGIALLQVGWILSVSIPENQFIAVFLLLGIAELLVPVWAESAAPTTWHPGHISERYGLFTIIVLGESVLAASQAIQSVVDLNDVSLDIAAIIAGAMLILFSMWWLYFEYPADEVLTSLRRAVFWGYGHYVIWGAAAAVGVGISVLIDYAADHSEITRFQANASLAAPVALFLLGLWAFHDLPRTLTRVQVLMTPAVALLVLLAALTSVAPLVIGLILAGLVTLKTVSERGQPLS